VTPNLRRLPLLIEDEHPISRVRPGNIGAGFNTPSEMGEGVNQVNPLLILGESLRETNGDQRPIH
jgi:hypothetical protein